MFFSDSGFPKHILPRTVKARLAAASDADGEAGNQAD
jgi:hypothetical protein